MQRAIYQWSLAQTKPQETLRKILQYTWPHIACVEARARNRKRIVEPSCRRPLVLGDVQLYYQKGGSKAQPVVSDGAGIVRSTVLFLLLFCAAELRRTLVLIAAHPEACAPTNARPPGASMSQAIADPALKS